MRITENQYACHDLIKRPKFTFAQSKRLPPKHNLRGRENNSLEQAAFWHAIKVACGLSILLIYTGEITMTVGRSTELEELFAWTNIWWIRFLPNPVGRTQKAFFFPEQATPKVPSAPILKQISILRRANPGNQHPSCYSETFRNHGIEYREWLVENISWQLVSKFSQWELP